MAKNKEIKFDPISYLKYKNDGILDRYQSFNQKISFYLTIISILLSTLILIFKEQINNIKHVFIFDKLSPDVLTIHIILSSFISICTLMIGISFILLFKEILNGLEPITLTEYDYEAIDLYLENKKAQAVDTIVADYKYIIKENLDKMNKKYSLLFKIKFNFQIFFIAYLVLIVSFIISIVYGK